MARIYQLAGEDSVLHPNALRLAKGLVAHLFAGPGGENGLREDGRDEGAVSRLGAASRAALYHISNGCLQCPAQQASLFPHGRGLSGTFRSGGLGGQNQNKRETGVRITHPASGAVGEARDQRSQIQNRRIAFGRLVESRTFQTWLRIEAARTLLSEEDRRAIENHVDRWMQPEKLRVELFVASSGGLLRNNSADPPMSFPWSAPAGPWGIH